MIASVHEIGGELDLRGERIHFRLPRTPEAPQLVEELRSRREEIVTALRERGTGGRVGIEETSPYQERLREALNRVCKEDYLPGTLHWLEGADTERHRLITEYLPDEISSLWERRAPLSLFQWLLDRWVEAHENVCALFLSQRTERETE